MDALANELSTGTHAYKIISGQMKKGYQPRDFFVSASHDNNLVHAHTFRPSTENRHLSFARLRETLDFVPRGNCIDEHAIFLKVLKSPQTIVASLVASKNADGSTFILMGHHRETLFEEGCAIIHSGMTALTTQYGLKNP